MKIYSTINTTNLFKRLTATLLAVTFMFAFGFAGKVQAATATRRVETSDVTGTFYSVTTTANGNTCKPFYQTQTEHHKGVASTVTVSHSSTATFSAYPTILKTVGVTYANVVLELCQELGIAQTSTVRIGPEVSYIIPASTPNGMYRVEAVFPLYKTRFYAYNYDANGPTEGLNAKIDKVPSQRDAYLRLNRYSDIIN